MTSQESRVAKWSQVGEEGRSAERAPWTGLLLAVGLVAGGLCLLGTEHRYGRATVEPVVVRPAAGDAGPVIAAGKPLAGAGRPLGGADSPLGAGTRLVTRPIEQLKVGDRVVAHDPHTGARELKVVRRVFQRRSQHLRRLAIEAAGNSGRQWITTTDEHPFWVWKRGWVRAGELAVGDRLRQADGKTATLVETSARHVPGGRPVYNLEIDRWHTYFVAADRRSMPLLVHNCNADSFGKLYHYTSAAPADILARGLVPGATGKIFLTPNPTLSPLQAHLGLALPPNRGLPHHLLEIDVATLKELGVEISELRQVGRRFNLPGGELEATVTGQIPAEAIRAVR